MTTHTLPPDHAERLTRARRSLDGLSVGDCFCSQFFMGEVYHTHFASRTTPPGPWRWTDDTAMAISIVDVLARHGHIDQYDLATLFARSYVADTYRGYGPAAHGILTAIHNGTPWRNVSHAAFGGEGSMGNGGAMRVPPVGAYFADDLDRAAREADLSAEVTHAHPEGRAGAIAIAVATAVAFAVPSLKEGDLLRAAIERTPEGRTREGIEAALALGPAAVERAARVLGNGSKVTAPDTVPISLWLADRFRDDFVGAMWAVIMAGGDVDTVGAIVGGVVAGRAVTTIPPEWLVSREPVMEPVSG